MRTKEQIRVFYEQLAIDYVGQATLGRYRKKIYIEGLQ